MKLELNRREMEQAIKCFINAQGIDIKNQEMKCVFSRETVSVELTAIEKQPIEETVEEPEEIIEDNCDKETEIPTPFAFES
jgi:hypothetical protein